MIRAVIFDLGDTLMYALEPWQGIFSRAARALSDHLCASGLGIDCDTFDADFLERLNRYYAERDHSLAEPTVMNVLADLLFELGLKDAPADLMREALDKFYAITQLNWRLEDAAPETLATLQNSGLRLGLVSNAGDEPDVLRLVDNFGISNYFEFVLTSASVGFRKPHPVIFTQALAHWNFLPDEVAMVGVRLEADVLGAGQLGIYTVLVKRHANKLSSDSIHPDAVVETLSDLPALFGSLSRFSV